MHEYDTSTYNKQKHTNILLKHITINILSKLQIKNATREALRKKERACRAQRTRSQIANENVKQKGFVRFYFWSARI
jgi:hypothetical protein